MDNEGKEATEKEGAWEINSLFIAAKGRAMIEVKIFRPTVVDGHETWPTFSKLTLRFIHETGWLH